VQTPIKTYFGASARASAPPQPERRTVLRGSYGSCIRAAAPSAAAPARATAPARSASRPTLVPSSNGFAPAFNWNNGVPGVSGAAVPRSDAQRRFVTGRPLGRRRDLRRSGDRRPSAALPELEHRHQYALTSTITVGAAYAGSHGDFLGGSGRGPTATSSIPLPRARQPALTQTANATSIAAARAIVPTSRCPTPTSRHDRSDAAAVPAALGVTDVYGNVASRLPLAQLTMEQRRGTADPQRQLHVQPHRDNLAARTGTTSPDWASASTISRTSST
jgi:hypothetical protein